MEIEKSKVLIQFLLNFRQSGDVLFFLYVPRLRGYTATQTGESTVEKTIVISFQPDSFHGQRKKSHRSIERRIKVITFFRDKIWKQTIPPACQILHEKR